MKFLRLLRHRGGCVLRRDSSLLKSRSTIGVLATLESERRVIRAPEFPKEQEQEHRSSEDIEDTVPDHLGRYGDDVAALCAGPCDRVGDKHKGEVSCADEVSGAEGFTGGECRAWCVPEEDVPNVEESGYAEDVVAPLVVAVYECADETGDDEEDTHVEGGHDVGE